jgi:hypothetical protein
MSFSVKVELNSIDSIERRLGIENNGRAQLFLANEAYRRMSKYVPFRTGKLRDTVNISPSTVDYLVPYARRQYYENRGSGIRGKYWDKKMLSAEGKQLITDVQKYVEGGSR